MAIGDKADLISVIDSNIVDNDVGSITPANVRTAESGAVTYNVNMEELAEQVIKGLINVKGLQFDTAVGAPSHRRGHVFYDIEKEALSYYNDATGTVVNTGQEIVVKIHNDTGVTIPNGKVVRYAGHTVNDVPAVVLSIADTVPNAGVAGVTTHTIPNAGTGYLTTIGAIGGVDTSAYSNGAILYLSSTVAGDLTDVSPPLVRPVAIATKLSVSEGIIFTTIREVLDPKAFAQNTIAGGNTMTLSATPQPVEGYTNTPFSKNTTVLTPVGGDGSFRTIVSPESTAFGGYYDLSFLISGTSSANVGIFAEVYVNGSATGVTTRADFTNNSTDSGALVGPRVFTQNPLLPTDQLEVYMYTDGAATNFTVDSLVLSSSRVGNV
jgi:hypothetical protein